jgi:hypothetical protein
MDRIVTVLPLVIKGEPCANTLLTNLPTPPVISTLRVPDRSGR